MNLGGDLVGCRKKPDARLCSDRVDARLSRDLTQVGQVGHPVSVTVPRVRAREDISPACAPCLAARCGLLFTSNKRITSGRGRLFVPPPSTQHGGDELLCHVSGVLA